MSKITKESLVTAQQTLFDLNCNEIAKALQTLFDLNGNKSIFIKMLPAEDAKPDTVEIIPCSQCDVVEYYLIKGASFVCYGGDTLEKVAESLTTYQQQYAESLIERTNLDEFRNKIHAMTNKEEILCAMSAYSDWYKDVYGHRPHTQMNQMMTKANALS